MTDGTVAYPGEGTPEMVAYKLLKTIASNEMKMLESSRAGPANADREWLLSTYAECLAVVQGKARAPSGKR